MPGMSEVVILLISVGLFVFWILMLLDCATKMDSADPKKTLWIIIVVLLGVFGAGAYYLGPRSKRLKAK